MKKTAFLALMLLTPAICNAGICGNEVARAEAGISSENTIDVMARMSAFVGSDDLEQNLRQVDEDLILLEAGILLKKMQLLHRKAQIDSYWQSSYSNAIEDYCTYLKKNF